MGEVTASPNGIEDWIVRRIVEITRSPPAPTPDTPFAETGLSSVSAVELVAELEDRYSVELSPTFLFDHSTPTTAAHHLARLLGHQ